MDEIYKSSSGNSSTSFVDVLACSLGVACLLFAVNSGRPSEVPPLPAASLVTFGPCQWWDTDECSDLAAQVGPPTVRLSHNNGTELPVGSVQFCEPTLKAGRGCAVVSDALEGTLYEIYLPRQSGGVVGVSIDAPVRVIYPRLYYRGDPNQRLVFYQPWQVAGGAFELSVRDGQCSTDLGTATPCLQRQGTSWISGHTWLRAPIVVESNDRRITTFRLVSR